MYRPNLKIPFDVCQKNIVPNNTKNLLDLKLK